MSSVGAFEAKAYLSRLLDQVERGEEITITRHGRAVARLMPVRQRTDRREAQRLTTEMKAIRKGGSLKDISIKELTHGGHKH